MDDNLGYPQKWVNTIPFPIHSKKWMITAAVPPWQNPETSRHVLPKLHRALGHFSLSSRGHDGQHFGLLSTHGTCGKKHLKHGGFIGFIWFIYDLYMIYMVYIWFIWYIYMIYMWFFIGWTSMKCGNTCGKNGWKKAGDIRVKFWRWKTRRCWSST